MIPPPPKQNSKKKWPAQNRDPEESNGAKDQVLVDEGVPGNLHYLHGHSLVVGGQRPGQESDQEE